MYLNIISLFDLILSLSQTIILYMM